MLNNYNNFSEVFTKEIESLKYVKQNLNKVIINEIITKISQIKGKLIVSGIGKSGHIGKKIAATLASTGTESFFIHSTEAFHGDLGMINSNDAVLLLSYSGETDEVLKVLNYTLKNRILSVAITGNEKSNLATKANYHLNAKVINEACSLNLAPTSSTTSTLVLGDAIAVALMKLKKFKKIDFAKYHPGGSLGRRLLLTVSDIMIKEKLPILNENMKIEDVIYNISSCGFGIGIFLKKNSVIGVLTDGDIRRILIKETNFKDINLSKIINRKYIYTNSNSSLENAKNIMLKHKILSLPVINKSKLVGLIQYYDL